MAPLTCPKCKTSTLNILQSAIGLDGLSQAPLRCARCKGFWISLSSISALQEGGTIETLEHDVSTDQAADKRTGLCPKDHCILSRTKAAWRRPFYIERCKQCDGIWLDAGEWRRLSAEHLLEHLDELWAPAWRHKLLAEQNAESFNESLELRLGELAPRVEAMARELATHPHGDFAMTHLRELFKTYRRRKSGRSQS